MSTDENNRSTMGLSYDESVEQSKPLGQLDLKNSTGIKDTSTLWNKAAVVISLLSLVVSIVSIFVSIIYSFKLSDYERTQSRIPNVCFLNSSIRVPFTTDIDSNLDDHNCILNFSEIDTSYYPIKIPIRNIGVGLAQNCVVEFSIESQIQALEQCRERLNQCGLRPYTYYSHIGSHKVEWYTYLDEYCFRYEDDKLSYIEYLGCSNHADHCNYLNEISRCTFSYILPLHEENSPNYLVLPEYLSAFILESIHQEMVEKKNTIFDPIVLAGKLNYQDIDGNEYVKDFELRFSRFSDANVNLITPEIFIQIESH